MRAEKTSPPMTVEEFLDWAEGREGRYELEDGAVIAMAPERVVHARVKARSYLAVAGAIDRSGAPCEAFVDSIAVRIAAATSYVPDVLVQCGEQLRGEAREATAPVVVVEVLSPSTAYRDASAKLAGYFRVAALHHYLIVDPGRRLVIHHSRGVQDVIETRLLAEGDLVLDPPGLTVSIADMLGPEETVSEESIPLGTEP
ncbi:Uma2 family endonuclease [Enterovirga rhinocerotis]|uniref:Uma2 family endonuclease n=1 Tax=Enterovirga rhinocerotis TaxID=1339210 RepID=A0A4R7CCJ3_9HYPH|nr:Uma2 family endonuclease [Enterovirga rhinocerotis]TDR95898.1 Uma2 family endonuclease [Enterovirga rhinocerotis]